jgi:hypothetical protein
MMLVWHAVVWSIWSSRNDIVVAGGPSAVGMQVDKVKLSSWKWFLGKNPSSPYSFYEWEVQPYLCWIRYGVVRAWCLSALFVG